MGQDISVLLIDDDCIFRETFQDCFVKEGFEIQCASGGYEAIDRLSKENYDAVITDIRMPEGSGFDVLNYFKDQKDNKSVLICLSGYSDLNLEKAYEYGADSFFKKPISPIDLMKAVEYFVAKNRQVVEFQKNEYSRSVTEVDSCFNSIISKMKSPLTSILGINYILHKELVKDGEVQKGKLIQGVERISEATFILKKYIDLFTFLKNEERYSKKNLLDWGELKRFILKLQEIFQPEYLIHFQSKIKDEHLFFRVDLRILFEIILTITFSSINLMERKREILTILIDERGQSLQFLFTVNSAHEKIFNEQEMSKIRNLAVLMGAHIEACFINSKKELSLLVPVKLFVNG